MGRVFTGGNDDESKALAQEQAQEAQLKKQQEEEQQKRNQLRVEAFRARVAGVPNFNNNQGSGLLG